MAEGNIVDLAEWRKIHCGEEPPQKVSTKAINPNNKITFSSNEGKVCGHLIMVDGRLTFEGNADASAMVFFDYLMNLWNVDKK